MGVTLKLIMALTRTEKVTKLANAIREYRGMYHAETKAWIHAPKKAAVERVKVWLERLHLDQCKSLSLIEGFKSFDQFNTWLRSIAQKES